MNDVSLEDVRWARQCLAEAERTDDTEMVEYFSGMLDRITD